MGTWSRLLEVRVCKMVGTGQVHINQGLRHVSGPFPLGSVYILLEILVSTFLGWLHESWGNMYLRRVMPSMKLLPIACIFAVQRVTSQGPKTSNSSGLGCAGYLV